ncbi:peroxidase family protein [Arthrobacter burdickii]|uniref:Heme peroxidase family protein n=1 Tax=Arthrobacter burdickii TaxID=3035920 RepID=A0ABT8K4H3_9MICC|nr:heme peroxidase family protein [Arthrobacter burdickii]MDN4612348.1 heme peroxidase family protein [Arthrobacter burdickii]
MSAEVAAEAVVERPSSSSDEPSGLSRRGAMFSAAGASLLSVLPMGTRSASAAPAPAPPVQKPANLGPATGHAVGDPRGADIAVKARRSQQGRFGLMFPSLKPFAPSEALLAVMAQRMIDPRQPLADVSSSEDGFDNAEMPAGYTYLGQFMDHDITHDITPLSQQKADPLALVNFNTPFFDLSSVYGRGQAEDPQLYDPKNPALLLVGTTPEGISDVPRTSTGAATIGDARNDENLIVSQMHLAFLKLHNHFVGLGNSFADARRLVRWHYQWVIVNDFLPRMVGSAVVRSMLLPQSDGTIRVDNKFYKPGNRLKPMIPLEFSVCAYRFGHSMIRAEYEMHDNTTFPLFGPPGQDLRGSRPLPYDARADWNYFFDIPGVEPPMGRNTARLLDTQLSFPLANLPPTVVSHIDGAIYALAHRNLLRGVKLGLPAGQDVATALGVPPIPNTRLGLYEPEWGSKAPLWFYILKEAELQGGRRLGPVGGRIIAEVILGLLALDPDSYLNSRTRWTPADPAFGMGELFRMSGATFKVEEDLPEEVLPEEEVPEEGLVGDHLPESEPTDA